MPMTKKKRGKPTATQKKNLADRTDNFWSRYDEIMPAHSPHHAEHVRYREAGRFMKAKEGSKAEGTAAKRMLKAGGKAAKLRKKDSAKRKQEKLEQKGYTKLR